MKTAVIIDDQTAVRQMLEFVVAMETGFTVAGSAGDGKQAWELCERTKPDLVILEVLLPKLNGFEILKRLREHFPSTRTLVFSAYQNLTVVKEAMRAGAHGYVEKSAPLADLKEGIRAVSEDRIYFGPEIAMLLRNFVGEHAPDLLTRREREVLKLIAESHSTKQIASKLSVSFKTAENHRTSLMKKLGMHDVASLTRFAIEIGLIESGGRNGSLVSNGIDGR